MSENYVQLPPDSSGKKTRTINQTIGSDDVHQQVMVIGDPSTPNVATITNEGEVKVDAAGVETQLEVVNSLIPSKYDHITLGYTGEDLTTVTYRMGGPTGTVVSTLTLGYTDGKLTSVSKS